MKKYLTIFFLLIVSLIFGAATTQDDIQSRSYVFSDKLNRNVSFAAQSGSAVKEVYNMIRPSPGVSVGWKTREGYTDHNTTTLGAYQIKSLHQFVNKDIGTRAFIAQANDNLYSATNDPPAAGTTFGSSVYALTASTGVAFSDRVGDDWVGAANGTTPWAWSGGTAYPDGVLIDRAGTATTYHNGYDKVRDTNASTYITWAQDATADVYIGFRRRLKGLNITITAGTGNIVAANLSVKAMRSSSWAAVTGMPSGDGTRDTATSTKSFNQSGAITWTASSLDEPYVLPGTTSHLFWYKLELDADVTDGIKVEKITVIEDCQAQTNLWSGRYNQALGVILETSTGYENYTSECVDGSDYSYMDVGGLTTSYAIYAGFSYPAFGIGLQITGDGVNEGNIDTAATATVSYWNAVTSGWVSVGAISDGTMSGTYSLNHSGLIQWNGQAIYEDKREFADIPLSLYWYKIAWNVTLPLKIYIWDVAQTQKPDTVVPFPKYDGIMEYNGRAIYWPGYVYKSGLDYSEEEYSYVLNGPRAGSTGNIFGPGTVNAAAKLHSYAVISTKDPYRLYLLEGKVPRKFDELLLSAKVGCLAPHTMVTIEDNVRIFSTDRAVHSVIFLSHDGVYLTDGMTVMNISQAISDLFNDTAPYIEMSTADDSYAWIDYTEKTVHFAVPINTTGTGTQSTLNREIVYNYITDEWYDQVVRANPAACGIDLIDSNNERLPYIGDYAGYVYRCDGADDSGSGVTAYVTTADFVPVAGQLGDALNYQSTITSIKAKAKAKSSGAITLTLYPDNKSTGVTPTSTINMISSGYGYAQGRVPVNEFGETFSIKFQSDNPLEIYGYTIDYIPTHGTLTK